MLDVLAQHNASAVNLLKKKLYLSYIVAIELHDEVKSK